MYTDEQFEELEQEELAITNEGIAAMLLILAETKGNLEKELRSFYQEYGKDGVVTWSEARKWISEKDHRRRMTALLMLLTAEFGISFSKLKVELEKTLKSVIGLESGFFDVELSWEAVLQKAWGEDDATWLKRLENDTDLWTAKIATDWKRSFIQRKKLDDVLKILDKRFNSIASVVEALGLSESTAVGSLARQKIFAELGIKKYRVYTKVDERRCGTCGAMHGLEFPISAYEVGVTASPFHPRCRCWEVPVTE